MLTSCLRGENRKGRGRKGALLALPLTLWSCAAAAQSESVIVDPVLPYDYDQDRNVSLRQQLRIDYGGSGIRTGRLLIFPRLETGAGLSDNVFLTSVEQKQDLYLRVAPAVDLRTDWMRHGFNLSASSVLTRYLSQSRRNRDSWNMGASGRLDIGNFSSVSLEGRVSRLPEEPFSSGLDAARAILSSYRQDFAALRGVRQVGRTRLSANAAYSNFDFDDLDLGDGTFVSQADRDRKQFWLAGQAEYALSPGAVVYGQITHNVTDFALTGTPGRPARDSAGWRVLGGLNADLPGLLRGTAAAGYARREFDSPLYDPIGGFSAEAEVTYFHDPITNVSLAARRVLQDSPAVASDAFFENSVRLTAERTVRRNLLLGVGGFAAHDDYVGSPVGYDSYQVNATAEYYAPRLFSVRFSAAYSIRNGNEAAVSPKVNELSALLSLNFHP